MRRALPVLLLLSLVAGCTGAFFHPNRRMVRLPEHIQDTYRDIEFEAADGTRLHGRFLPATDGGSPHPQGSRCTVLYLHGNAGNLSTHSPNVLWLPARGINVFMFDYRGYGLSAGRPSLDGIHLDMAAALDKVFTMEGVDPDRVAVFGQSLGGAVAIVAVARSPWRERLAALIVDGAFSSYRGIAREKLAAFWLTWPFQLPFALTVDDRYKPLEVIAGLAPLPVLVVHGTIDSLVPVHHGEALYQAAREPKQLWLYENTGHIAAFIDPANRDRFVEYLKRC